MSSAVYAGSFDPFTLGHLDVLKKAFKLFDKVYVAIAVNPDKDTCMFSPEARRKMMEKVLAPYMESGKCDIVILYSYDIVVDLARSLGCSHLIRGIRGQNDIQHERMIYDINRDIASDIETVFIMSDPSMVNISSSLVRNVIKYSSRYANNYTRLHTYEKYMPYEIAETIWSNGHLGES